MAWRKKSYLRKRGYSKSRKYGKRFTKYVKSMYRRKSRLPVHRTGLFRPTGRATKLAGIAVKKNTKPENKFILTTNTGVQNLAPQSWQVLWATSGADPFGFNYFAFPTQGTGVNNRIGSKINTKYIDLRFNIRLNTRTSVGNYWSVATAPQGILYRVVVLRQRQKAIGWNNFDLPNLAQQSLNVPLNSKKWDVQFDRTYYMYTGFGITLTGSAGGFSAPGGTESPPKRFRFKIPLKLTMDIDDEAAVKYSFEKDIFVGIYIDSPISTDTEAITSPRPLIMDNLASKYFFTDI